MKTKVLWQKYTCQAKIRKYIEAIALHRKLSMKMGGFSEQYGWSPSEISELSQSSFEIRYPKELGWRRLPNKHSWLSQPIKFLSATTTELLT